MFKKPFNKKVGETRTCKHCSSTFHTFKPRYSCNVCLNAAQKIIEQKKRALNKKKDKYPFSTRTTEADRRFCSIRTALSNAWKEYNKTGDKSYVIAHYDKQLKEIKDNGIWQWIWDRRTDAKKDNQIKSRGMIKTEFPDTRGYYED